MKFKKKKKKTMSVYNIKRMKLFKINEKHSLHLKIFNIYIYIYKKKNSMLVFSVQRIYEQN
jgi:hypothetical protein